MKKEEKKGSKSKQDDLELVDIDSIGKKKSSSKTVFDYIRYGIMVVAAAVFVVAGYNLYSIFSEYARGEETYANVEEEYTIEDDTGEPFVVTGDVASAGFTKTVVDFANLQQANPDVKGWIQFEALDINYPVLKHPDDNDFYLKKMWNKEENTAGSIFMDVANAEDMTDYNTFIYGHNMKNLTMFGQLKQYKDAAFYTGKEYFWIYTPTANYRYQIFSVHESKVSSNMFRTYETQGPEFTQYVADSKKNSRYDTGVPVSDQDRIVTLSTCTASGDNWRLLLQAKLIGVEYKSSGVIVDVVTGAGVEESVNQAMQDAQPQ